MNTTKRILSGLITVILIICLLTMWQFRFRGTFVIYLTVAGIILGLWNAITGHTPRTLIFFSFLKIHDEDDASNLPGHIVYPILIAVLVTAAVMVYLVAVP